MKGLTKLLSLILIFILAFSFSGCSSYKEVDKAITKLGYTLEDNRDLIEVFRERNADIKGYAYNKKATGLFETPSRVVVLEFKHEETLLSYYQTVQRISGHEKIRDYFSAFSIDIPPNEVHQALKDAGLSYEKCLIFNIDNDPDVTQTIIELNN